MMFYGFVLFYSFIVQYTLDWKEVKIYSKFAGFVLVGYILALHNVTPSLIHWQIRGIRKQTRN